MDLGFLENVPYGQTPELISLIGHQHEMSSDIHEETITAIQIDGPGIS